MGSALQLCTLGFRGDFLERDFFASSTDAKPKGPYRKTKELLFRTIGRLVLVQMSCCAGRGFPHTGRQILKVKLDEISIAPTKEAGAALGRGNFWQTLSITASSGCHVSQVVSGPL